MHLHFTLEWGPVEVNDLQPQDVRCQSLHHIPCMSSIRLHYSNADAGCLQKLMVNGNILQHLPASIGGLSNLRELFLQCNLLQDLPADILNLTVIWTCVHAQGFAAT